MSDNSTLFKFGTKGETLDRLSNILDADAFLKQYHFTYLDWQNNHLSILDKILDHNPNTLLAVRSSAIGEDGNDSSMAGAYESCINVMPECTPLSNAINRVFNSYQNNDSENQVLIQPMVTDVEVSGVVLTRDLDTGSPYFVINYDDISGRTDSVTSGIENKCILVHHNSDIDLRSSRFKKLIKLIKDIQYKTRTEELDIEFAISADESISILQVRPLAAKTQWSPINFTEFDDAIYLLHQKVAELIKPDKNICGQTTIFGEMPDWNPAEIIGNCPRPLALSLYKHLITDSAWSRARILMGYKDLGDTPLLIDFNGRPYIDVRKSFNSFLPAGLDTNFSEQLIDHQLNILKENPHLHDKIEFEIAITCRDFNFNNNIEKLHKAGFAQESIEDFSNKLRELTYSCLTTNLDALYSNIDKLRLSRSRLKDVPHIEKINKLLSSCINHGTIPFAQLARHAFIGISFLKSAVTRGIFSQEDFNNFLRSIDTVATDISESIHLHSINRLSYDSLMEKYGHLRPGTYDILSYRYDENPDLYLGQGNSFSCTHEKYELGKKQKSDLTKLLNEEGYDISADQLISYITKTVRMRESAKFEFTHNISDALSSICDWAKISGLSREDSSYIPINKMIEHHNDNNYLRDIISSEKEKYKITRSIRLPHLITTPEDISIVRLPLGRPTFITNKSVTASIANLEINKKIDIQGHIVFIESADPGFDWIFSKNILGLITKYGGANSHMAIRCAEFGLPAAIGCGDRIFNNLSKANIVELNCASHNIKAVN